MQGLFIPVRDLDLDMVNTWKKPDCLVMVIWLPYQKYIWICQI